MKFIGIVPVFSIFSITKRFLLFIEFGLKCSFQPSPDTAPIGLENVLFADNGAKILGSQAKVDFQSEYSFAIMSNATGLTHMQKAGNKQQN